MGMELNVTVPTSLAEIKLKDYQTFIKISSQKDIDDTFLRQKIVQIFCHIPLLAVNKMRRKDFILISNSILEVLQQKPKLQTIIKLKGREFGFIPDLDNDLTLGEFVDLDEYMKDWKDFHKVMAVFYRPIIIKRKHRYIIEDYTSAKILYENKDLEGIEKLEKLSLIHI